MTGEELKRYRQSKGLTQKRLGLLAGYNEASAERVVQLWEHNKQPIPITRFRVLAQIFGIPVERFIP